MKSSKTTGAWVVMKFGGSSLATEELREAAASRVSEAVRGGNRVVVVASAIGRSPQAYATDTLLRLIPGLTSAPRWPGRSSRAATR